DEAVRRVAFDPGTRAGKPESSVWLFSAVFSLGNDHDMPKPLRDVLSQSSLLTVTGTATGCRMSIEGRPGEWPSSIAANDLPGCMVQPMEPIPEVDGLAVTSDATCEARFEVEDGRGVRIVVANNPKVCPSEARETTRQAIAGWRWASSGEWEPYR